MAKKAKGAGISKKNQYTAYKAQSHYAKNKRAKLERHLKKYPDDEQAKQALENVSPNPRRKTPNTYMWSKQQIERAQLLAKVGLNGNVVLNKKHEENLKDQIIGFGSLHALDEIPKSKKGKGKGKGKPKKEKE